RRPPPCLACAVPHRVHGGPGARRPPSSVPPRTDVRAVRSAPRMRPVPRRRPSPCNASAHTHDMHVSATLVAYEGASFLLVAPTGDIPTGRELGLYHEDTRFLSQHTLLIADAEPLVLSARASSTCESVHFSTNPALPGLPRGSLVIRRVFRVGGGLHADLDITNFGAEAADFAVELLYDADFADVFEVKRQIEAPQP